MLDKLFMADDKYPSVPSPCKLEKRAADEIKVEGILER